MPRASAFLLVVALAFATASAVGSQVENAWLIVVDDLHVEFIQTGRLRDLLRAVAKELIREDDAYQLRTTGPNAQPMPASPFISDRNLPSAIKAVNGNGLNAVDVMSIALEPAPNELLTRANRALDAVEAAVSVLADDGTSRKAILYVSTGHDVETFPSLTRRLEALAERARGAGIPIFAFDARGLLANSLDPLDPRIDVEAWRRYTIATRLSLSMMTEQTGGFVIERTREPGPDLKRIDAQMRR